MNGHHGLYIRVVLIHTSFTRTKVTDTAHSHPILVVSDVFKEEQGVNLKAQTRLR